MTIFDRLQKIREHRRLEKQEIAAWLDLSGASYGRKEKGKEGGLGLEQIAIILEKTQTDARYLFDQIKADDDDRALEMADLKYSIADKTTINEMLSELKILNTNLQQNSVPPKDMNPVHELITKYPEIRRLLNRISSLPAMEIEKLIELVSRQLEGIEKEAAKESGSKAAG